MSPISGKCLVFSCAVGITADILDWIRVVTSATIAASESGHNQMRLTGVVATCRYPGKAVRLGAGDPSGPGVRATFMIQQTITK